MRRTLLLVAAFAVALPALALAQQGDPRIENTGYIGKEIPILEIDDCPPLPQVSSEELRRIGSEHFSRGEVLYVQGDYRGAVKELVAAYCIAPYYTILKDIGQAYERELDYERAIAYLERFVTNVPDDAKRMNPCAPDPQDEKRNVLARIAVLGSLKAKILINTDPADAKITLSNDAGIAGRGVSGQELEVGGGTYEVLIEKDGYHPETETIPAKIGKPYTIFTKLRPLTGTLRVRVVPADARLFLEDERTGKRQVGAGAFEAKLERGRYTLSAEAEGRLTVSRQLEVLPGRDTTVSFELPPEPQFGRRQLLAYATFGGAAAGGLLAGASENGGAIAGGIFGGAAAGFFGTFFGTSRQIPLGTSSLTITASLIGGTAAGGTALLFSPDGQKVAPIIGGGLLVGAGVGYYAGSRLRIRPGDAAVINSGALWGTVTGALFLSSLGAGDERLVGSGIVLSGLGMGTLGGVLLTRYYDVSRARAALIDVGGIVGIFTGIAIESVVSSQTDATAPSETESQTNFALGGMAAGLVIAGVLTRNMDAPKLSVSPVVTKTTSGGTTTTTFGIGGAF